jgi:hypothetical protein
VRIPAGGAHQRAGESHVPGARASVEIVSANDVRVAGERTPSGQDAQGPWRLAGIGAREPGARWTLPNVGGSREVVVTNVSPSPAHVEMHFSHSYSFDDDVVTTIEIPARQRFVYPLDATAQPRLPWINGTLRVTSQPTDRGTAELVVETLRYADVGGVERARSSGLIGARVP